MLSIADSDSFRKRIAKSFECKIGKRRRYFPLHRASVVQRTNATFLPAGSSQRWLRLTAAKGPALWVRFNPDGSSDSRHKPSVSEKRFVLVASMASKCGRCSNAFDGCGVLRKSKGMPSSRCMLLSSNPTGDMMIEDTCLDDEIL
jgi:hypothetical protein